MRIPTRYELDPKAPKPEQPVDTTDLDELVDAQLQAQQQGFEDVGEGG